MTWQHPYSVKRLLHMIRGHDFGAEYDYDGEDDYARGIVGPAHVIAVEIDRDAAEAELEAALKAALAELNARRQTLRVFATAPSDQPVNAKTRHQKR